VAHELKLLVVKQVKDIIFIAGKKVVHT
jgi:hypothetical protein